MVMCFKKRTGQSSMEFVLIAAVMFLVFLGVFVVIQERMNQAYKGRFYNSMEELSRLVSTEIRMAESTSGSYVRQFSLPYAIGSYDYSIQLLNMTEIVISVEGIDYVVFLDVNVSGNISKGRNVIYKTEYNISINALDTIEPDLCELGEVDDEGCGVIDCSGWYAAEGNECYNKQDITTDRCEGVGNCKDSNSEDCNSQLHDVLQYSCAECEYIASQDCNGISLGACSNYTIGTWCSGGRMCDGYGNCNIISGATAFVIKDNAGQNISKFDEAGNIILKGSCTATSGGVCTAPADSFVIKNSLSEVVTYVDNNGNLCVKDSDCKNNANCDSPGLNSFIIKDATGTVVIYINEFGSLCFIGQLTEHRNP